MMGGPWQWRRVSRTKRTALEEEHRKNGNHLAPSPKRETVQRTSSEVFQSLEQTGEMEEGPVGRRADVTVPLKGAISLEDIELRRRASQKG